jgi:hypothetical protein
MRRKSLCARVSVGFLSRATSFAESHVVTIEPSCGSCADAVIARPTPCYVGQLVRPVRRLSPGTIRFQTSNRRGTADTIKTMSSGPDSECELLSVADGSAFFVSQVI